MAIFRFETLLYRDPYVGAITGDIVLFCIISALATYCIVLLILARNLTTIRNFYGNEKYNYIYLLNLRCWSSLFQHQGLRRQHVDKE